MSGPGNSKGSVGGSFGNISGNYDIPEQVNRKFFPFLNVGSRSIPRTNNSTGTRLSNNLAERAAADISAYKSANRDSLPASTSIPGWYPGKDFYIRDDYPQYTGKDWDSPYWSPTYNKVPGYYVYGEDNIAGAQELMDMGERAMGNLSRQAQGLPLDSDALRTNGERSMKAATSMMQLQNKAKEFEDNASPIYNRTKHEKEVQEAFRQMEDERNRENQVEGAIGRVSGNASKLPGAATFYNGGNPQAGDATMYGGNRSAQAGNMTAYGSSPARSLIGAAGQGLIGSSSHMQDVARQQAPSPIGSVREPGAPIGQTGTGNNVDLSNLSFGDKLRLGMNEFMRREARKRVDSGALDKGLGRMAYQSERTGVPISTLMLMKSPAGAIAADQFSTKYPGMPNIIEDYRKSENSAWKNRLASRMLGRPIGQSGVASASAAESQEQASGLQPAEAVDENGNPIGVTNASNQYLVDGPVTYASLAAKSIMSGENKDLWESDDWKDYIAGYGGQITEDNAFDVIRNMPDELFYLFATDPYLFANIYANEYIRDENGNAIPINIKESRENYDKWHNYKQGIDIPGALAKGDFQTYLDAIGYGTDASAGAGRYYSGYDLNNMSYNGDMPTAVYIPDEDYSQMTPYLNKVLDTDVSDYGGLSPELQAQILAEYLGLIDATAYSSANGDLEPLSYLSYGDDGLITDTSLDAQSLENYLNRAGRYT